MATGTAAHAAVADDRCNEREGSFAPVVSQGFQKDRYQFGLPQTKFAASVVLPLPL